MGGKNRFLAALVANRQGQIFELPGFVALGADGTKIERLTLSNTRPLEYGAELMLLPQRQVLAYNLRTRKIEKLVRNPYDRQEAIFPVAAFNPPGLMVTHTCAHLKPAAAQPLPLFSYGAVGWHKDGFRSAVTVVDTEPRQDLRRMPEEKIRDGVKKMAGTLPGNRLRKHLEKCALVYGCPAGKNFFLGRYEAPLPTSRTCNARCLGCISWQPEGRLASCQERIGFTPTAEEIAQVALAHIEQVPKAVVSFGQGCEGDPLMAAGVIRKAIGIIRRRTSAGTINMNTNASLPDEMAKLFDAGLDSIRVSLNSLRRNCYRAYFRPRGYRFDDVLESITRAGAAGVHVAVNYLNLPGFTDTSAEMEAFFGFQEKYRVNMIQWRNLNFDPLIYLETMARACGPDKPVGVEKLLEETRSRFPGLVFGYFNPPKEKFDFIGKGADNELDRSQDIV